MKRRGPGVARVYHVWRTLPPSAKRAGVAFLVALGLLVLTRETAVGFYRVRGASMAPTLHPGDYVLADKTAFGSGLLASVLHGSALPSRGDVVVFKPRRRDQHGIKRVVALPGDTLAMRGGKVP